MNELTVNWHIIEKCNYKCTYCFAKYKKSFRKEIHESKEDIEKLLFEIYNYFSTTHEGKTIRLNIAGGEPTLSKNLCYIIQKAYEMGFKVSLITNGSKITKKFIEQNACYISMFAMSIDSIVDNEKKLIGRVSRDGILSTIKILKIIEDLRKANRAIQIKINTVVNHHNYTTYLGDLIDIIQPEKWKVLQALSLGNEVYCTKEAFESFLKNHSNIKTKIFQESASDMQDSYIMVDPYGRFYQNSEKDYIYSEMILDVGALIAFKSVGVNMEKYEKRYKEKP